MADRDNPNTHIENQKDAELPREQPQSPKNEGIDPLTEGDTMYPSEDTKAESEELNKREERAAEKQAEEDAKVGAASDEGSDAPAGNDVGSLTDRDEPNPVGKQRTEPVKADGKVQPQTKKPAKTNDSEVANGSSEPDASDTNAATGEADSKNAKVADKNGSGTSAPTAADADGTNDGKLGNTKTTK